MSTVTFTIAAVSIVPGRIGVVASAVLMSRTIVSGASRVPWAHGVAPVAWHANHRRTSDIGHSVIAGAVISSGGGRLEAAW